MRGFLKSGGKVLLMLDPPAKGGATQPSSLIALAKEWGIQVGDDIVVDPNGEMIGADASVPVGMPVAHPITANFKLMTVFRLARSVTPVQGGVDGKIAQTFIQSGPDSWAETDVKGLYATGRPEKNFDKGDHKGPVSVAAAVSAPAAGAAAGPDAPKPETRFVVVGDSDFGVEQPIGYRRQGQRRPVPEHGQLAGAAGEPDRDSPEGSRRSSAAAHVRSAGACVLVHVADRPWLLFGNAFRLYWKRR